MAMSPVAVGIGEILWDLLPSGKQMGGAPANFAFQARALGAESFIVSAVGNDEPGREILRTLDDQCLDRRHVSVLASAPTGAVSVRLDDQGVPAYDIHQNVAWDFLPWTSGMPELAARADAVCFGTLAQRSEVAQTTIRAFLDAVRPGAWRVFDLNLRQSYYSRELIRGLLQRSNVLKLNDDELRSMARLFSMPESETEILERLLGEYPLELIALTKGPSGSRLFGRSRESRHPGCPVAMADSVGAGDAFTAALVVGLLKKKDWDDISDRANRVAAFVCSQPGAWPRIPAELAAWP
jgi:fructokinase